MNTAASNYQETTQFIHQRYEDTAFIIFQQQQKIRQDEKRRLKQKPPPSLYRPYNPQGPANQPAEFSRYGNRGVLAKEPPTKLPSVDSPTIIPRLPDINPKSPGSPSERKPTVKSSTDKPDQYYKRQQRGRRRNKVVVSIESSV